MFTLLCFIPFLDRFLHSEQGLTVPLCCLYKRPGSGVLASYTVGLISSGGTSCALAVRERVRIRLPGSGSEFGEVRSIFSRAP